MSAWYSFTSIGPPNFRPQERYILGVLHFRVILGSFNIVYLGHYVPLRGTYVHMCFLRGNIWRDHGCKRVPKNCSMCLNGEALNFCPTFPYLQGAQSHQRALDALSKGDQGPVQVIFVTDGIIIINSKDSNRTSFDVPGGGLCRPPRP